MVAGRVVLVVLEERFWCFLGVVLVVLEVVLVWGELMKTLYRPCIKHIMYSKRHA